MTAIVDRPRGRRSLGVLFAEDFDLPSTASTTSPEPEVIVPSFSAVDIASAREAGWADGYGAGNAEAANSDATATRVAVEAVAAGLTDASDAARAHVEQSAVAVAQLLLGCLASTFPMLCARHGEAEIRAIMRAVLPALAQEPAITVRANPRDAPGLARELAQLDADLVERVQLTPTEAVQAGDVRISWHNGVALRDAASLWRQVADVLLPAGVLPAKTAIRELQDAAG